MHFLKAKSQALEALREGRIQHEARAARERKNLLAIGTIGVGEAISLIAETRGDQATSSPHHAGPTISVWVFKPRDWYIKFYFKDDCFFVSFHKNETQPLST